MPHVPAQLDYAPSSSARLRRLRRAIIAATFAIAAIALSRWSGPAIDHVALLYYQGRCLDHVDPPGRLVFDTAAPASTTTTPPGDWDRFYTLFSPPGGKSLATLFVHQLRHKDGHPRLVAIDLTSLDFHFGAGRHAYDSRELKYTVLEPGRPWSRPALRCSAKWECSFYADAAPAATVTPLRLYAGQLDPADPAHFTIAFDFGRPGTIDGWLRADDTLLFEIRDSRPLLSASAEGVRMRAE